MQEERTLGHVACHVLSKDDFRQLCQAWLSEPDFHHVVTLNPEMVMQAETDQSFRKALMAADVRVSDGAGIIWAQWYLRSDFWPLIPSLLGFLFHTVERITGVDAILTLAALAQESKQSVYLLGGTPSQNEKTAARLRRLFPELSLFSAPDHRFDLNGPQAIVADIQARQPAVLLVAYGAPKQTLWIKQLRAQLSSVRIAIGVGGAFGILAEERPRAPRLLRRLNLEWLWRLGLEPRRLPRIWQATVQFPLLIKRQKEREHASLEERGKK